MDPHLLQLQKDLPESNSYYRQYTPKRIHKSGTYVIENKSNGKKYVGRSSDIQKRLKQHNSGSGSKWTGNFSGKWTLVKTYKGNDNNTENKIAKGVMRNEGIENVRGGSYCKTYYPKHEFRAIKKANGFVNNVNDSLWRNNV